MGHRGPKINLTGAVTQDSLYIPRAADQELLRWLSRGESCCVLDPRQSGKTSLVARTILALEGAGVDVMSVDLQSVVVRETTRAHLFSKLAREIASIAEADDVYQSAWEGSSQLPVSDRWDKFLRALISRLQRPLVVFVDEIDKVMRGTEGQLRIDGLFDSIRAAHNKRGEDPRWSRLTFCLVGVARREDLVADPTSTPFNVGETVRLAPFSRQELTPLLPVLSESHPDPDALLDRIWWWSGGHPYPVMRLASDLRATAPGNPATQVDDAVARCFTAAVTDPYLTDMERRFTLARSVFPGIVELYRRVVEYGAVPYLGTDPTHETLRLTGLVALETSAGNATLVGRNRIVLECYGRHWVDAQAGRRPYAPLVAAWLANGRNPGSLPHGEALDDVRNWAQGRADLSPEENEFIQASLDRQAAESQRERDGEARVKRLAVLVAVVTTLLAIALAALGGLLWLSRAQAMSDTAAAEDAESRARAALEAAELSKKELEKQRTEALASAKAALDAGETAKLARLMAEASEASALAAKAGAELATTKEREARMALSLRNNELIDAKSRLEKANVELNSLREDEKSAQRNSDAERTRDDTLIEARRGDALVRAINLGIDACHTKGRLSWQLGQALAAALARIGPRVSPLTRSTVTAAPPVSLPDRVKSRLGDLCVVDRPPFGLTLLRTDDARCRTGFYLAQLQEGYPERDEAAFDATARRVLMAGQRDEVGLFRSFDIVLRSWAKVDLGLRDLKGMYRWRVVADSNGLGASLWDDRVDDGTLRFHRRVADGPASAVLKVGVTDLPVRGFGITDDGAGLIIAADDELLYLADEKEVRRPTWGPCQGESPTCPRWTRFVQPEAVPKALCHTLGSGPVACGGAVRFIGPGGLEEASSRLLELRDSVGVVDVASSARLLDIGAVAVSSSGAAVAVIFDQLAFWWGPPRSLPRGIDKIMSEAEQNEHIFRHPGGYVSYLGGRRPFIWEQTLSWRSALGPPWTSTHHQQVRALAVADDGRSLYAGFDSGTIAAWAFDSPFKPDPLMSPPTFWYDTGAGAVVDLVLSKEGNRLGALTADGWGFLFPTSPEAQLELACRATSNAPSTCQREMPKCTY